MDGRITVSKPKFNREKLLRNLNGVSIRFQKELDSVNLKQSKCSDGLEIWGKVGVRSSTFRLYLFISAQDNSFKIKYTTNIPQKITAKVMRIVKQDLSQVGIN